MKKYEGICGKYEEICRHIGSGTPILNKGLFWFLESNNILSPSQYGFRRGRNTPRAIIDLDLQIEESPRNDVNVHTIFLDLQEMFSAMA